MNTLNQPFVSCIMPTANRQKYIPYALAYFMSQDYLNSELVIIDDGKECIAPMLPEDPRIRYFYTAHIETVGLKRNYACEKAYGEIIVHWDDDDWYGTDWLSQQVNALLTSGADICGLEHVHHFSGITDTLWVGTTENRNNPGHSKQWLHGATLAYWKSFWEDHPFKNLQTGEDDDFVKNPEGKVYAGDYIDSFVSILHPYNTAVRYFESSSHKVHVVNYK